MKDQAEIKSGSSQFLKTDGGKTKSNGIEIPSISLPKGGEAVKGIDEKFSVNAVNGTSSFSIPLPFSPARWAMEDNKELEKFNTEYIYKRFSSYIDGNNIKFGKPMFTVDMLIQGSVETCNSNPDREITYVVDYMFDYYCS